MRSVVTALLLLLTISCGGSQGTQMNSSIQRGPMPEGGHFAGIWFGNWGEMSISTQGSSIVGEFCQEDRNRYGRVEGTAQGNVMTLHWITYDVSMAGARRESDGSAMVQYEIEAQGEGESHIMVGSWGYGTSNADGGVLRFTRSARRSERFIRGVYSLECELREEGDAPPPMNDDDVEDNPDDNLEEEGEGSVLDEM